MTMVSPGALHAHLQDILGLDAFVALTQHLGGLRLYVPHRVRDDADLVQVLGRAAADILVRELAPATIRVPLARRTRAIYYRAQGLSNGRIARLLGITENGVGRLFAREGDLPERPARGHKQPQQLPLL